MKTFGFAALAAIAALVLGFGARLTAPTAHADTTALSVVGCEFLAGAADGDTTNGLPTSADVLAVCGPLGVSATTVANLADALGDKDGVLEESDLTAVAGYAGNQLPATCTAGGVTLGAWAAGLSCTLDVFAFVDNEATVTFDAPSGVTFSPSDVALNDFTCDLETEDEDCNATVGAAADGVVEAGLLISATGGAAVGTTKTITVTQDGVDQTADVTVVGFPHNVDLTLAESTIQATGSTALFGACLTDNDVADSTSLSQPETTVSIAVVTDADGTKLTRVPVHLASDHTDIADIGTGDGVSVVGNTYFTLDAGTSGVAEFAVICGGKSTGTATITATINPGDTTEDTSDADITVVGAAAAAALTASPAQIACDGSQTATVTAKVTDSAGNNVADGTDVTFSVVALGTANPIKVKTVGGSASSTITPLSGSTAGVTVVVTAGDAQSSIRVDCSLPIPPTAVPPGAVATPTRVGGTIGGPDTGNGGYLGQSGSAGFPTWTLVALALGSVALVAGGMVTRRAGK